MSNKLDRRKKYTRMVLKESLMKRLQEKPISSITIKEICELADINRSTFYSHYSDLYDLLYQMEDEILEDISQTMVSCSYTEDEEAIQMTTRLLEYLAENREICQTLFSEHGDPTFQKKVMMFAREYVLKTPPIDNNSTDRETSEYLSLYIANGSIYVIQHWLNNGLKQSPEEMAELIIKLGMKGLSSFQ
ncbi:Transcriptional regulator C-terminal region [Evansella caseinilytica]|uniref:Transcriptional regulator C-terminal region n=1 Tax=Evansella caseinilytica TaxID=1503961 RepID=A0A1H3I5B1_9BACI|nr:TetR-like C-terminal domain-containing protein [Evansella caseinilytica]SDY22369.1 Transcriptional regulator C-terminal region [Evansella caseinilytica]